MTISQDRKCYNEQDPFGTTLLSPVVRHPRAYKVKRCDRVEFEQLESLDDSDDALSGGKENVGGLQLAM